MTPKSFRRLLAVTLGVASGLAPALAGADVVKYVYQDAIGNVRVVTDAQGNVIERHDYLPTGEEWCGGQVCSSVPAGQPLRFTGKERDTETGLDYFGARYYSATLGRFTTVDPAYVISANLVDPQLWNRYSYVRNNPLRHTDPDGRLIDILADVVAIEYDILDIGVTLYARGELKSTHFTALGGDVIGAAVPFLTGVGAGIRAAAKGDKLIDAGRGTSTFIDAGKAANNTREGMGFTRAGKKHIDQANAEKYSGKNVCENCKADVVPGKQHEKGVRPPGNERQRDHIDPRSKGGRGIPDNGQILCRDCNIKKSDK
jgi:RHS repeat-associated protein